MGIVLLFLLQAGAQGLPAALQVPVRCQPGRDCFVQKHVEPVVGEVEALSGYRNPALNQCAGGAKESAHRRFYALDLTPLRAIGREGMIRSLCAIHRFRGRAYDIGLGFYSGRRFHIDGKGFRKWGANGKGESSPCNA